MFIIDVKTYKNNKKQKRFQILSNMEINLAISTQVILKTL